MRSFAGLILSCMVIGVARGDTLATRRGTPAGTENIEVRLAEIDVPEKGQAFGNRRRQHLADVCLKTRPVVKPRTADRYGRTVAPAECGGVDANAERALRLS